MHKKDSNILIRVEALNGEHMMIRIICAALFMCVAAYLYFVGVSIMNVIAHREASAETERLRSVVGNLEKDYFVLAETVSKEQAAHLGLSETGNTSFVRRQFEVASNVRSDQQ